MSLWLVEGGHRAQLLPFHQVSQHVSRLVPSSVPSSVNAPTTRLLVIATRKLSIEVPEDNDTVMKWRTVQEIFQFVQRVGCGWTLSPAVWDVHTYHTNRLHGEALILAKAMRGPRQPVCITYPAARSNSSIATPAYLCSAGAMSPVKKNLLGRNWPESCVSVRARMPYPTNYI